MELTTQFAEKAGQLRRLADLTQEPGQAPQLTTKGAFCRGIWIKELLVTEMAFDGTLAEIDPAAMAGWAAAVVWESRPQDEQLPPAAPSWLAGVHLATDRIVRWTGSGARNLRVEGRIAPVVSRWAAAADDAMPEGPGRARTATGRSEKTPHEDVRDLAKFLRGYHLEPETLSPCAGKPSTCCARSRRPPTTSCGWRPAAGDPSASERLRQVRDTARAAIAAIDRGVVAASRTFRSGSCLALSRSVPPRSAAVRPAGFQPALSRPVAFGRRIFVRCLSIGRFSTGALAPSSQTPADGVIRRRRQPLGRRSPAPARPARWETPKTACPPRA